MPKTTDSAAASPPNAAVGQEVVSYCTKCKIDLAHMIVAMKGDRIMKVQCKTCEGFHTFRAAKGITEAPKKRAPRAAAAEKRTVEEEWTKLMKDNSAKPMKDYSPKSKYGLGDRIAHHTFGDGVVGKLLHPNKLEIVFQTDIRILIHCLP